MSFRGFIFVFMFFFSFAALAQEQELFRPWYSVGKAEELKIKIFFEKRKAEIDPVYDFHLKLLCYYAQKNKKFRIKILSDGRNLSRLRVEKIKTVLLNKWNFPEERIKLSLRNAASESVFLYMDTSAVSQEEDSGLRDAVGSYKNDLDSDEAKRPFSLGVFLSSYHQKEKDEYLGFGLRGILDIHLIDALSFYSKFSWSSLSNKKAKEEADFYLGLQNRYKSIETATLIYYKKNSVERINEESFVSYNDVGLSQDFRFNLYKRFGTKISLGTFGDFSFSNNLEALPSSNILTYGFFSRFKMGSKTSIELRYEKRKLKKVYNLSDAVERFVLFWDYSF